MNTLFDHHYFSLSQAIKNNCFNQQSFNLIHSCQLDRYSLEYLFELSDILRSLSKFTQHHNFICSLLTHKRAMLYFTQPSTRTFLSFQSACQRLGMCCSEIRDPSTSSEAKGETIEDAIRTFSSYVDLIIMRSPIPGLCERMAELLSNTPRPVPIINAGSGADEHPTQSLLDMYTLHRSFKQLNSTIDDKTICLVGDLKRGRTIRSLAQLLCLYNNIHLVLCSPENFRLKHDIKHILSNCSSISFEESVDFQGSIAKSDAIYMTRIQDEWDTKNDSNDSDDNNYNSQFLTKTIKTHHDRYQDFHLLNHHLNIIKPNTIIMHPFPRRQEIDPLIDKDHRAKYWQQERNGMWTRLALMALIMGVGNKIIDYSKEHSNQK